MKEYVFLIECEHIQDYQAASYSLDRKMSELLLQGWKVTGPASISTTNWKVYILLTLEREIDDGQEDSGQAEGTVRTDI